jgi:ribosomal protein S18 acetylase RimI-like enzyme
MQVSLRPARLRDREFLYRVYESTRSDELAAVPWAEAEKTAFLRAQFDAQDQWYRENYMRASYDVVYVDGEPAGRLYLYRAPSEIRIVDIALLPSYRGAGVGSRLMRGVLAEADARGKRVTIHVERLNPALRLYERLGFKVAEDKGVYLFLER